MKTLSELNEFIRDNLEAKAARHGGVVISYLLPVPQNCPMTIDQGVVLCRINGYREFVTWKYGISGGRLECNHGHYHSNLTSAVEDFNNRVETEQKNLRGVA